MLVGVPLLTTAVGGLPELITHKKTGWLVPLGNEEKLVTGAASLLARPAIRNGLAMEACERVTRDFPVHKFITNVEAIYPDVAAKPASAMREQFVAMPLRTN
jgi:glycosyltransferase involved in cell wall biosynthesis